jgi:predicted GTPase
MQDPQDGSHHAVNVAQLCTDDIGLCICLQASSSSDVQRRLVVGLTGYPNVGKSSTINALFGEELPQSVNCTLRTPAVAGQQIHCYCARNTVLSG